jgi:hypothetical protein
MSFRSSSLRLVLIAWCFLSCAAAFAQTKSSYLITGRVIDESNHGVEKARVCAKAADYDQLKMAACGLSDVDGNFVIRAGRPGHYTLLPERTAAGYQWPGLPFYRNPAMPLVEVDLTEANQTAAVSVPLGPKNGVLTGRGVDALTGRPIENLTLRMCHAANPLICRTLSVKNASGEFSVGAALVPFTLVFSSEAYEDWWGVTGVDKNPVNVPSGAKLELILLMKRRPDALNRPLSEAEKSPSVNLPAPIQLSPADRTEFNFYPRQTKLEWQPVEGAASYSVEIDVCDGRDRKIRECVEPQPYRLRASPPTGILGTSYEFSFVGAQPGRWRVWAVDTNGLEGFKSPWRLFFYLK